MPTQKNIHTCLNSQETATNTKSICWVLSNRCLFKFFFFFPAAFSPEVCPEQRCFHALPQSPPDPSAHPGHLSRQRDRGEHGGVAQGRSWWGTFTFYFTFYESHLTLFTKCFHQGDIWGCLLFIYHHKYHRQNIIMRHCSQINTDTISNTIRIRLIFTVMSFVQTGSRNASRLCQQASEDVPRHQGVRGPQPVLQRNA